MIMDHRFEVALDFDGVEGRQIQDMVREFDSEYPEASVSVESPDGFLPPGTETALVFIIAVEASMNLAERVLPKLAELADRNGGSFWLNNVDNIAESVVSDYAETSPESLILEEKSLEEDNRIRYEFSHASGDTYILKIDKYDPNPDRIEYSRAE